MDLNKVFIIGRLTADPQLRTTPSGESVASFSLATNHFWKDRDGNRKENTEFHNIIVWGKQAEVTSQYLSKGAVALVEGRLQTRVWEGKDGGQRRTTEIVAERVQFGPRAGGAAGGGTYASDPRDARGGKQQQAAPDRGPEREMPVIDLDEDSIRPEDLPF